jgi:hypothetical protein
MIKKEKDSYPKKKEKEKNLITNTKKANKRTNTS